MSIIILAEFLIFFYIIELNSVEVWTQKHVSTTQLHCSCKMFKNSCVPFGFRLWNDLLKCKNQVILRMLLNTQNGLTELERGRFFGG